MVSLPVAIEASYLELAATDSRSALECDRATLAPCLGIALAIGGGFWLVVASVVGVLLA